MKRKESMNRSFRKSKVWYHRKKNSYGKTIAVIITVILFLLMNYFMLRGQAAFTLEEETITYEDTLLVANRLVVAPATSYTIQQSACARLRNQIAQVQRFEVEMLLLMIMIQDRYQILEYQGITLDSMKLLWYEQYISVVNKYNLIAGRINPQDHDCTQVFKRQKQQVVPLEKVVGSDDPAVAIFLSSFNGSLAQIRQSLRNNKGDP